MRILPLGCVLLGALVSACGGDGSTDLNNVNVVTPTSPMGFVGGTIVSAVDDTPISGAQISVFGGGVSGSATTDGKGQFSVGPIAAGAAFSVSVTADGFAEATMSGLTIDDTAGNFPTANGSLFVGPVGLVPLGGNYSVQVVDDTGAPIQNAQVTFEASPRFVINGANAGSITARVMSDVDGLAKTNMLPNIRQLPPAATLALAVQVGAIDRDNDGVFDLRGESLVFTPAQVRNGDVPVIVLHVGAEASLQIVASNLGTLVPMSGGASPVIGITDPIRVVFNKSVERDSITIDLRDEIGTAMIAAPYVVSASGTVVTIDPAEDLQQGREYNISISASSVRNGAREMFSAATPFFARVDPNVMIAISGRFRDANGDAAWGNDGDALDFTVSIPIGRGHGNAGGSANMWVALDFNGTGVIGDGQGELPASGQPYPGPLAISLLEPAPGNGAGLSNFTRYFASYPVALPTPIGNGAGGVAFEIQIAPEPLVDISGRAAPDRTTGTALFQ